MLAKKYRLPVQSVPKTAGVTRRGRYFLLKSIPAAKTYSRLSVVVGASVAARATKRNQLKRLVYTQVQKRLSALPVADYLLIMRAAPADRAAENGMINELKELL